MSSGRSMFRHPAERLPMDLFFYMREAVQCFDGCRYLAAIEMASTAVELILNRDRRLRTLPFKKTEPRWMGVSEKCESENRPRAWSAHEHPDGRARRPG